MHSIVGYVIAAGIGGLIAHFISQPPELRSMRLSQLIFVPVGFVLCFYFLPDNSGGSPIGSVGEFVCFLGVLGFLIILIAPNLAYLFGAGISNLVDPQNWTSAEEELALRPIHRLIDKDQFSQALTDLNELLKRHKPTYEALLIKAKLLHHFGSVDETVATLLKLIPLSHSTAQQLVVMELLEQMEQQYQDPASPFIPGMRTVEISHELVLFLMDGEKPVLHKEIAPGPYKVEEALHRNHRWLRLEGENWGNAEMCWDAVRSKQPAPAQSRKILFGPIARLHEAIAAVITRKPRRFQQAEAKELFKEAGQLIRRNDWQNAVPLLQKASARDPDHYEIAFRLIQAVRFTSGQEYTEQIVRKVLNQSQWTQHEEEMIRQAGRAGSL